MATLTPTATAPTVAAAAAGARREPAVAAAAVPTMPLYPRIAPAPSPAPTLVARATPILSAATVEAAGGAGASAAIYVNTYAAEANFRARITNPTSLSSYIVNPCPDLIPKHKPLGFKGFSTLANAFRAIKIMANENPYEFATFNPLKPDDSELHRQVAIIAEEAIRQADASGSKMGFDPLFKILDEIVMEVHKRHFAPEFRGLVEIALRKAITLKLAERAKGGMEEFSGATTATHFTAEFAPLVEACHKFLTRDGAFATDLCVAGYITSRLIDREVQHAIALLREAPTTYAGNPAISPFQALINEQAPLFSTKIRTYLETCAKVGDRPLLEESLVRSFKHKLLEACIEQESTSLSMDIQIFLTSGDTPYLPEKLAHRLLSLRKCCIDNQYPEEFVLSKVVEKAVQKYESTNHTTLSEGHKKDFLMRIAAQMTPPPSESRPDILERFARIRDAIRSEFVHHLTESKARELAVAVKATNSLPIGWGTDYQELSRLGTEDGTRPLLNYNMGEVLLRPSIALITRNALLTANSKITLREKDLKRDLSLQDKIPLFLEAINETCASQLSASLPADVASVPKAVLTRQLRTELAKHLLEMQASKTDSQKKEFETTGYLPFDVYGDALSIHYFVTQNGTFAFPAVFSRGFLQEKIFSLFTSREELLRMLGRIDTQIKTKGENPILNGQRQTLTWALHMLDQNTSSMMPPPLKPLPVSLPKAAAGAGTATADAAAPVAATSAPATIAAATAETPKGGKEAAKPTIISLAITQVAASFAALTSRSTSRPTAAATTAPAAAEPTPTMPVTAPAPVLREVLATSRITPDYSSDTWYDALPTAQKVCILCNISIGRMGAPDSIENRALSYLELQDLTPFYQKERAMSLLEEAKETLSRELGDGPKKTALEHLVAYYKNLPFSSDDFLDHLRASGFDENGPFLYCVHQQALAEGIVIADWDREWAKNHWYNDARTGAGRVILSDKGVRRVAEATQRFIAGF